jgi:hypothetical protein
MQLMRDVLLRLELARFAAAVRLDAFPDTVAGLAGLAGLAGSGSIKRPPVA